MKPEVERSRSGRVFQTAYRADVVARELRGKDGGIVMPTFPARSMNSSRANATSIKKRASGSLTCVLTQAMHKGYLK